MVVTNTEYWMGPDITVATATKGRVRAFGRVWDFDGRSAEICQIDWSGPGNDRPRLCPPHGALQRVAEPVDVRGGRRA